MIEADIEITEENLRAYEVTQDITIFYNEDTKDWYAENDNPDIFDMDYDDVIIIDSKIEGVSYEDNLDLWGYILIESEWEEIKDFLLEDY